MAKGKSSGSGRTRNFATVVYPDSENTPADWMDILTEQKVPFLISPLHDRDINVNGEPKKPHYHVMVCFEGVKTSDQAKAIFELVAGVGCEVVQSLRGYARYLCHLDNPEKAQYDIAEVRAIGGADYATAISLVTDKYKAIREMMYFVRTNNIVSYDKLLELADEQNEGWFRVLCDSGTYVIKEYLKSRKFSAEQDYAQSDFVRKVVEMKVAEELKKRGIEE